MCGIWAYIFLKECKENINLFKDFLNLERRGPDNSIFQKYSNLMIGFHRLSIIDLKFKSNQPYVYEMKDRKIIFICNGEIYIQCLVLLLVPPLLPHPRDL